jgi:hypothetical protein
MPGLMTISEMRDRHEKKEDAFDLTIEKWIRIRRFLDTASTVADFNKLFEAANVAIPFCFEYQPKGCIGCPLEEICGRGRGERLLKVMRLIQIHVLAILAGNMLRKETVISQIDALLTELTTIKAAFTGQGN